MWYVLRDMGRPLPLYTYPFILLSMKRLDPNIVAVCGMAVVLLFVAWQQTHPAPEPTITFEPSGEPCRGEPIPVAYPYRGSPEDPHECKVQCDDNWPRYIFYSNGLGTQCDTPPSCNDRGEDDGVTCTPPTATQGA